MCHVLLGLLLLRTQDWGLKLFIQQNTQKNTKEIASYIEQDFILWFDKYIYYNMV